MRNEYLVESSSDGIFAFDEDLKLTICNKVIRNLLGICKKDSINTPLLESIELLDKSVDLEDLESVLLGESIIKNNQIHLDEANEAYVHFSLELSPVYDERDIIIGGMGVLKQIQKFETGLFSNEEGLSTNSTPSLLPKIVFDLDGKLMFFNDSYRQLWDISPKVEKYMFDHYNLFNDEQLADHITSSNLKNEVPEICFEVPLINYNTKKTALLRRLELKRKTLSGHIHPQRNSDGEVNSIEVTLIDLTGNDKSNPNFHQKFEKLTKNLPGVIYEFVTRPDGTSYFRFISSNCLETFGISNIRIQQESKLLRSLIHTDDIVSYLQSVKKAETSFDEWEWEGRFNVLGEEKWVSGTSRPEKETDGSIVRYGILTNISAEKKAQINEGIALKRLELALQGGDLGLWDMYLNTGEFVTNDRFDKIIGHSLGDLRSLGKDWLKNLHVDDRQPARNQMIQHLKKQSDFFDIEMRVINKGGTWDWIHSRGQVTEWGGDGRAIRLTGTVQNINQRKIDEHTLLESERRYRDLIEYSPLAISIHSEGKIVFANEQSGKLLGFNSSQELIGRDVFDFVHKDDLEAVRRRMLAIYKGGSAAPIVEERFIDANGKEVIVEVAGIPYEFEGKRAIQTIARDVTDKKKTEGVLKRSEQLLSQLFENVPIGIVLLDEKRRVVQINKGFEGIFGYSNDEAFGQRINDLIIPKEARGEAINLTRLITGGKVIKEVETTRKTKDGRLVPVMIYGLPVKMKGKVIAVYGIYVDMTVSKNVEEQLKVRNEELDNFVYKVSHDLRAPLSSTLGLIHLAKLEGKDADLKHYIYLIGDRILQLDRFIADVLSHSKNLNQEVVNTEIDFQKIIDDSFEELNYLPGATTIEREISIDKAPFKNDHWRISELLRNFISNAIKYLNPEIDSPHIKINIEIDEEKAVILFEDNGIGIAEDLQPNVFDMFFRATEYSEGSGLGLYIVKNAIDKMGGTVRLESTLYEGTKFHVSLPNK